jgi:hypothetical protein
MNVKNLNPLERHVEKIVLAVAAAGALYIGYLALTPITVPDTTIKPGEVEAQVTEAVNHLQDVRQQTAARKDLNPRLANYVKEYENLIQREPLKPELVDAAIPQFVPLQQAIGSTGPGPGGENLRMQVVTPTVPPPKDVTAVVNRATIVLGAPTPGTDATPPAAAPGTPVPAGQTKDLNWVTISGRIPMADFIAEMNDPALQPTEKLTPTDQRSVLYQIEVQRHARIHGTWTPWAPVAPIKSNGDPVNINWAAIGDADLPTTVTTLDGLFHKIAEPDFYTLASGQPFLPPILTQPDVSATKPAVPPPPALTPSAAGRGRGPGAVQPGQPNPDDAAPAAAATPAAPGMPDLAQLRALPNIPFWFYDENVAPSQEYQYEVRIVMYNPTYRFSLGLKDPAMKNQPTLASKWVIIPTPVDVSSDLYFFVDSGLGGTGASTTNTKVGFRIFKWTNGNWYGTEGTAQPGEPVLGTVRLLDKANAPVDVDTGYTLVDVLPSGTGSDLTAVLLAPNGELVTRGSKADRVGTNAKRQSLEHDVVKPAVVPVTPKPKPAIHLPGNNQTPTRDDNNQ